MATATVDIVCSRCGCEFRVEKRFGTRSDANRYERWVRENICECTDCERKSRNERNILVIDSEIGDLLKDHPLPDISGSSAKQIRYAAELRNSYIRCDIQLIKQFLNNEPDLFKSDINFCDWLFNETDAGKIIDRLKRNY